MTKQTIEINVPEGYEVAEGEQPRRPVSGQLFLKPSGTVARADFAYIDRYIILKKKAPKYRAVFIDKDQNVWYGRDQGIREGTEYLERKALEDALSLVGLELMTFEDGQMLGELEELIK